MSVKTQTGGSHNQETEKNEFLAVLSSLPVNVDSRVVESAAQYVLMQHLAMPLITLNQQAEIEGGSVASWKISSDHKEYSFTLKELWYSDGSRINAKDAVESLQIHLKRGSGVHFDFSIIDSVKQIDEMSFLIKLRQPYKNFLNAASSPEFSIVHSNDRTAEVGKQTFTITSGPFRVVARDQNSVVLERNTYFREASETSPQRVRIVDMRYPGILDQIKQRKVDFLDFFLPLEVYRHARDSGMEPFLPHVSQTHAIGLNAKRSGLESRENRKYLQKILSGDNLNLNGLWDRWDQAQELYTPGGEGRIPVERLSEIWAEIGASNRPSGFPDTLTVLSSTNYPTPPRVKALLESKGISVNHLSVDRSELRKHVLSGNWDLTLSANDFAAADVLENLRVAMSPDMPIFILEKNSPVPQLLESASNTLDKAERAKFIREIAENLLKNGNIVPLAYEHDVHYYLPTWDISRWSTLFPDVAFWRLRQAGSER